VRPVGQLRLEIAIAQDARTGCQETPVASIASRLHPIASGQASTPSSPAVVVSKL
jgi:hypothetical protein